MLRKFLVAGFALVLLAVLAALWWRIDGERMPEFPSQAPAQMPAPDSNAFNLMVKAAQAVPDQQAINNATSGRRNPDTGEYEDFRFEEKKQVVTDNEETIEFLREALRYPYVPPRDVEDFDDSDTAHFGDFRVLARLLGLKVQVEQANDRPNEAMTAALDCIEMGRKIAPAADLMGAMTGVAVSAIGQRDVPDLIRRVDPHARREAIQRLEGMREIKVNMIRILNADRLQFLKHLKTTFQHKDWRREMAKLETMEDGMDLDPLTTEFQDFPFWQRQRIRWRSWTFHKGRIIESYHQTITEIENALAKPYPDGLERWPDGGSGLPSVFEVGLTRTIPTVWFLILVNETSVEALIASLALESHRTMHGTYPATLEDIDPSLIDTAPRDPFTDGQPLRYRRDGDGYVLYSIGPNGEDNDGQAMMRPDGPPERRYLPRDDLTGDLVAGVNVLRPGGHR